MKLNSNIPLIGLSENAGSVEYTMLEVSLSVVIDSNYFSGGKDYRLYLDGDKFILDFKEITYEIQHDKVCVMTKYKELFNSTFFNVPMSILLLLNNRILLHSSAFIRNCKLYPICAEKGMGKSTLLAYAFSQGDKVFCDDTLPLIFTDNHLYATTSTSYIKLNEDSYQKIGFKNYDKLNKNISNKAYLETQVEHSMILLDSLYFMSNSKKEVELSLITSKIAANMLVYGNVVGISWFNSTLISILKNCEIFKVLCSEIKLYKFNMIRQWDFLEANYFHLIAHC
jgi:hypothetical protein